MWSNMKRVPIYYLYHGHEGQGHMFMSNSTFQDVSQNGWYKLFYPFEQYCQDFDISIDKNNMWLHWSLIWQWLLVCEPADIWIFFFGMLHIIGNALDLREVMLFYRWFPYQSLFPSIWSSWNIKMLIKYFFLSDY